MTPLCTLKYSELSKYLNENNIFGLIAQKRKHTIIYTFERYYVKAELMLKVKVMRKTKYVISVSCNGNIYTDFNDVKEIIEEKTHMKRKMIHR